MKLDHWSRLQARMVCRSWAAGCSMDPHTLWIVAERFEKDMMTAYYSLERVAPRATSAKLHVKATHHARLIRELIG